MFHIDFITPLEVKKYIQQLKTSKASGADAIGRKILKLCGDHIVIPLTAIINKSISAGIFPDALKEAIVLPIKAWIEKTQVIIDPSRFSLHYLKYLKHI